jgi:hypothetical protein
MKCLHKGKIAPAFYMDKIDEIQGTITFKVFIYPKGRGCSFLTWYVEKKKEGKRGMHKLLFSIVYKYRQLNLPS